eukprot:519537-Rhodomonas_salina.2
MAQGSTGYVLANRSLVHSKRYSSVALVSTGHTLHIGSSLTPVPDMSCSVRYSALHLREGGGERGAGRKRGSGRAGGRERGREKERERVEEGERERGRREGVGETESARGRKSTTVMFRNKPPTRMVQNTTNSGRGLFRNITVCKAWSGRSVDCRSKHKKTQTQDKLDQECVFLRFISGCMVLSACACYAMPGTR